SLSTSEKVEDSSPPTARTAVMMATAMSAAIRSYSMAVVPSSSLMNLLIRAFMSRLLLVTLTLAPLNGRYPSSDWDHDAIQELIIDEKEPLFAQNVRLRIIMVNKNKISARAC